MKKQLFGLISFALFFTGCSSEVEEVPQDLREIKLSCNIDPQTRGLNLDEQKNMINVGQQIGVTVTGAYNAHNNVAWTVGEDGVLTNTGDPVYYNADKSAAVCAYHPYNAAWSNVVSNAYTFTVASDQSSTGYADSDLLWTTKMTSSADMNVSLTFKHMLAKVNVTLKSMDNSMNLAGAKIYITNTKTSTKFSNGALSANSSAVTGDILLGTLNANAQATAIIVPQTVTADTKFIKLELDGSLYTYKLPSAQTFVSGTCYNYELTINNGSELLLDGSTITSWTDTNKVTGMIEEEDVTGLKYVSSEDMFYITTAQGMYNFSCIVRGINTLAIKGYDGVPNNLPNANAKLLKDINLSDVTTSTAYNLILGSNDIVYTGVFDGNNHEITSNGKQMFCYKNGGTLKNIVYKGYYSASNASPFCDSNSGLIENVTNRCSSGGNISNVGLVCYINQSAGTIRNCKNYGDLTAFGTNGSIAQSNSGLIEACTNYGSVTVHQYGSEGTGSLVGTHSGTLNKCVNYGYININTGSRRLVGGLVGYHSSGVIKNCAFLGYFPNGESYDGEFYAFAGKNENSNYIINCYVKLNSTGYLTSENVTGKNVVFYKEATETGTVSFNSTTASYTKAQLGATALINQLNANVSALSSEYSDLCTWSLGDDGLPKLNF